MSLAWPKRWRIIAWIATAIAVGTLYEAAIVSTHHLDSPGWSPHARFHALVGGLYLAVLAVTSLLLAWGPLRGGARTARVSFAFVMLAIPACVFAATWAVPGGGPPALDRALAGAALVAGIGLAVACRRAD